VTRRDLERLAKYFKLTFSKAKAKFVTSGDERRRRIQDAPQADDHFGRICRFFDTEKRCCTVYEARPAICRDYPVGRCGYYDFLANERRTQEDPDHVALNGTLDAATWLNCVMTARDLCKTRRRSMPPARIAARPTASAVTGPAPDRSNSGRQRTACPMRVACLERG